ncbi:MAG: response regulator transcription factor [Fodinibius sp.]|nr:response regulator transcription factor [Fodinibius sp.]
MANTFKKKIVLVDDHPLMRKGLAQTLETDPIFEVVEQLDRGEELIQRMDELNPDLVIVDVSLPGMSGLELVKHIIHKRMIRKS